MLGLSFLSKVLSVALFLSFSHAIVRADTGILEEAFDAKKSEIDTLWDVSMKKLEVRDLEGELAATKWDAFKDSTPTVREVAALIIRDDLTGEIKLINMQMGTKTGVAIYFNRPANTTYLGRFHTHPYEYESIKNLCFSPGDVVQMYKYKDQLKVGFFSLIRSGEKYYAMIVEDPEKVESFFKAQGELAKADGKTLPDYLQKKFYKINHGQTIQDKQINSLIYIMGHAHESGIGLYETLDGNWKKLN